MKTASLVSKDVEHADSIWHNGIISPWTDATVPVRSVGHASVASVFEGIKAYWNTENQQLYVFRLKEHMQRFLDSIKIVRLGNRYTLANLIQATIDVLKANKLKEDTYIRPWNFLSGIIYEQIAPADSPTDVIIDTWPFNSMMGKERGCRVCVSSWTRISDNVLPPRVKTFSNYHNSRLASIEATANGYDWPLILNEHQKVTEGPGACVGLIRNGVMITPDIPSGIMESITRDTILHTIAKDLGIPVIERAVDRTELYIADEIFFMGTGWEVLPILEVDGLPINKGEMGPITKAIDHAYHDIVRGINQKYSQWLTPVWGE
ncbi:MAG: branched-chain amino acid aminotransferase [Deltaproteobacteria bacterium]|nr:MAG: branched-chain amino acid aminotransferase [Deltaproteobacteria bacterium]